ncbi:MAG: tRNA 2-selenouridine(34) synthase MnmH [Burkholderiaceae bacterium]|nr:tRNA 2-selenouridine(34) synthase MnmH [Burkholderiaceae bacterium]
MQLSIDAAVAQWSTFDTVIDVRSPDEWAIDHLPGAINVPVLSNAERAEIGLLYKSSPFEAKKRGAAMVARNIAATLEGHFAHQPKDWRPLVYCWRGGNRSNAMATILQRIGWRVSLLTGGYLAYRRFVIEDLNRLADLHRFLVVCGVTGAGKSLYLRHLQTQGEQVLDLEALAHHRGSLLGSEPVGKQPSQKAFDSAIWDVLRHCDPSRVIVVESESKKIGALQVPERLIDKMRASECIELVPTLEERVRFLCQDYAHFFDRPDTLMAQLDKLKPLVGGERLAQWRSAIQNKDWPRLVESLLTHHYDPTYRRSMTSNYAGYAKAKRISGHPARQAQALTAI